MSEIFLTNTGIALVDQQDLWPCLKYTWHRVVAGYAVSNDGSHLLHRYIAELAGFDLSNQIDHKNGNRLDCRRENLRAATNAQNQMNRKVTARSGYKGVYPTAEGRWVAKLKLNGTVIRLGHHDTAEQAHEAYCEKAKELFGEFFNAG